MKPGNVKNRPGLSSAEDSWDSEKLSGPRPGGTRASANSGLGALRV